MDDLIPIVAIFFSIGVPVMAIATHFVLRPLVRDIVLALRGGPTTERIALEQRVEELEARLDRHEAELEQLSEAESFRRRLEAEKG